MDGSLVGRSYAMLSESDLPALLLQRVARLRSTSVEQKYLGAWLLSPYFTSYCDSVKTVTAIPHISPKDIRSFKIALPTTIAEQEAIARALSDTDALIESLEQLLIKKRQIKQGAMQELLTGKRRLPGFKGKWTSGKLRDFGHFSKGRGVTRDQANSGNIPCVRYGEIYTHHNDYIRSFNSWISSDVAMTSTKLKFGDILFAGSGETKEDIGKCIAFMHQMDAYAGGDIVIFHPSKINSLYLGYYLNTPEISRQKASKGQGDAVVHIGSASLGELDLKLPEIDEQIEIVSILQDIDAEILTLEEKLTKAKAIKQGMMQELLTGRIRLV